MLNQILRNNIKRNYLLLQSYVDLFKKDLFNKNSVNIKYRTYMLLRGFSSDKLFLYDLENNDIADYIPDANRSLTRYINEPYSILLNDKILFELVISKFVRVPKNFAYIKNQGIKYLIPDVKNDSVQYLINACKSDGGMVFKIRKGGWGRWISIIKYQNGEFFSNGKLTNESKLDGYFRTREDSIAVEYIQQHSYSSDIFDQTTNTIRIITIKDPISEDVIIPFASHRFGNFKSIPLDNFSGGGLSSSIDIKTGVISKAGCKPKNNKMQWLSQHPDTGAPIEGVVVPGWEKVKSDIISMVQKLPFLYYVGWDVVITEDGFTVIEGNNHSDVALQLHGPLLRDPRVREFFRYFNVIK